jgi:hypothetical protein
MVSLDPERLKISNRSAVSLPLPSCLSKISLVIGADVTNEHARASLLALALQEREQVGIDLVRINSAHAV